jgi:uncharacterized protein (DUF1786 family)
VTISAVIEYNHSMNILTVDIGTGTQDIFLYDSRLDIENGFKMVLPSPTMIVHRRIKAATLSRTPILLTGHQMGGGPSAWAAEAHARAGLSVYATEDAARTLDDELKKVEAAGIKIVSEDEARRLPSKIIRIELRDFDFDAISETFGRFGISLHDLDAAVVAVFDHGAAPPGVSDRQFRFDYLDRRIRDKNTLSAFAYLSTEIPVSMTRLHSVADSASGLDSPLIVMDTAPAAIFGATFDPVVGKQSHKLIANIGNFHTLAFKLGQNGIEGVFEHHTGEIDLPKLEFLLRALADGSLKNEDVFKDMGHGALIYDKEPIKFGSGEFDVVVTGPRRSMFLGGGGAAPTLKPYFAVPFGDMMIAGCFGMLAATADVLPDLAETIYGSMQNASARGTSPWDVE